MMERWLGTRHRNGVRSRPPADVRGWHSGTRHRSVIARLNCSALNTYLFPI
jgi:hypothetical protein